MGVFFKVLWRLLQDAAHVVLLAFRSDTSIQAENLVLRRQIALFQERGIKPARMDAAARIEFALLTRLLPNWRSIVTVVRPETVVKWHREGWKLFWRAKCKAGRPCLPDGTRVLIRRMARENPLWGEERIANELHLKLGIRHSPRTIRKYMPKPGPGIPRNDQRWSTFLKNHSQGLIACDFMLSVTAGFKSLYVFVVIHHGTRRIVHFNITSNPTAFWAMQQLRMAADIDHEFTHLLHDQDSIFSRDFDRSVEALGLKVIRSPPRSPKANAICERVIGTIRRECLDWVIPLSERHLRSILGEWIKHYNNARPHSRLGPNVPAFLGLKYPPLPTKPASGASLTSRSVLNGLHHEYAWAPQTA